MDAPAHPDPPGGRGAPPPNRAARRAAGRKVRRLGALGSGAVLATGAGGAAVTLSASPAGAATFTVTSPVDDGTGIIAGSLSKAILDANAAGGQDVIDFAVPAPAIIMIGDLPKITEEVLITGPGAAALTIDLNGNCGFNFYELPGGSSTVSGLTISNGTSKDCNDDQSGGAIANFRSDADLRVESSVFTGNYAYNDGGAIVCYSDYAGGTYLGYADVTIVNSTFTGNTAYDNGGALYLSCYGDATITGSRFTGNESTDSNGGAVYADNYGDVTIDASTFTTNEADNDGGAIESEGYGDLTISNSTISGNRSRLGAGGIDAENYDDFTLSNSTVTNNDAGIGAGGGIYTEAEGDTTITNSTIAGNRAGAGGGGLYGENDVDSLTIVQSTFTGNHADFEGGAMWLYAPDELTIVQSTISGNTTGAGTGGIFLYQDSATHTGVSARAALRAAAQAEEDTPSPRDNSHERRKFPGAQQNAPGAQSHAVVAVTGTIVAGNTATTPAGSDDVGSNTSITATSNHSLFGIVDPLVTITDAGGTITGVTSPGLGPLQDNGGPTPTMALLEGSPAINAGPAAGTIGATASGVQGSSVQAAAAPPVGPFDQRGPGYPRIVAGRIDIGAFESQSVRVVPRFAG